MRWTRWSRRTSEAEADGEVVRSWPPDAEVKFASIRGSRATGARKPGSLIGSLIGSLGRARRKPLNPLRREGDLARPVVPSPRLFSRTGPRLWRTPGLPCALDLWTRAVPSRLGRVVRREVVSARPVLSFHVNNMRHAICACSNAHEPRRPLRNRLTPIIVQPADALALTRP
jgi:hypothetical protein